MADRSSEARMSNSNLARMEEDYAKDPAKNAVAMARAYLDEGQAREADRVLARLENHTTESLVMHAQARFELFDNGGAAALLADIKEKNKLDGDKRAQLLLGQIAFDSGNKDDAKTHLKKVLELDANNRRAALLLNALGEKVAVPAGAGEDDAIISYDKSSEKPESGKKAFSQLGLIAAGLALVLGVYAWQARRGYEARALAQDARPLLEAADVDSLKAAIGKFDEALSLQGGNDPALAGRSYALAMLWFDHGMVELKEQSLEAMSDAAKHKAERGERYAAEALVALAEGRPADAEAICTSVLARGGLSEMLYWTLGMAQRMKGDRKLGRENLRRAQESSLLAPHFATSVGDAYEDDNEPGTAAGSWSAASKNNPKYVIAAARDILGRVRKGESYLKLDEALKALEALPAESVGQKDKAAVALARAEYLLRLGQAEPALAAANQAVELGGESPLALATRGRILMALDKTEEALAQKKLALDKSAAAPRYFFELLEDYIASGNHKAALDHLTSKATELSEEPTYHVALGRVLTVAGKLDEAKKAFDKAFELRENSPDALLGMGVWAWKQKKYDDARDFFQKAITARSRFPEVYEAIGLMWVEQGASAEGNQQLEEADKQFRASGVDIGRMRRFYSSVLKAVASKSNLVTAWQAREKTYREGV